MQVMLIILDNEIYLNFGGLPSNGLVKIAVKDQPSLWSVFPVAKYWKNGEIHDISFGSVASFATGIFVK